MVNCDIQIRIRTYLICFHPYLFCFPFLPLVPFPVRSFPLPAALRPPGCAHRDPRQSSRDRDGQITAAAATSEKLKDMHMLYVHGCTRRDMSACSCSRRCNSSQSSSSATTCSRGGTFVFVARHTRVTYHVYAMGCMESMWGPNCAEFGASS
jgi:hypothetical protein